MLITGNVFKKLFSFLLNLVMVHGSAGLNLYSMLFNVNCRSAGIWVDAGITVMY